MADIVTPVTVMFGSKPAKAKSTKPNPTKAKPAIVPAPTQHVMDSGYKEPTHEERLHRAASSGHVEATHDYVAGRITSAQYSERKRRAEQVMAKTPKSKK